MINLALFLVALFVYPKLVIAELPSGTYVPGDIVVPENKDPQEADKLPGDRVFSGLSNPRGVSVRNVTKLKPVEAKEIQLKRPQVRDADLESARILKKIKQAQQEKKTAKKPAKKQARRRYRPRKVSKMVLKKNSGIQVYRQNMKRAASMRKQADMISLPSASIVIGTSLFGVEAVPTVDRPVLVELNYVWLGPNMAVVEMTNCRTWLDVRGDYTTQRVMGLAKEITCRAPSGTVFDIPIHAYIIDEGEEYLGAKGVVVARGKAISSALTFLQDGVSAFGKAMGAAQVTTSVTSAETSGSATRTNITGNQYKYMAGESISGSTAKFLNWWIKYYQSLQPTVAIGPGKKIYLAIRGSVNIPRVFFKKAAQNSQGHGLSKRHYIQAKQVNTKAKINDDHTRRNR